MAVRTSVRLESLLRRYDALKSHQTTVLVRWQEIADLAWPAQSDITISRAPGDKRTQELFDSTAIRARRLLAGNLQGAVTNPAIQWFRLRFRDDDLNEQDDVGTWLNAVDDRMLAAYNASNFYMATFAFYSQLAAFGTAAMFVSQRQDLFLEDGLFSLRFEILYPGSFCIEESPGGMIDTLFRRLRLSPRQAVQLFGEGVSQQTAQAVRDPAKMDARTPYLHCVFPRTDRDPAQSDNRNMPFADVVIDLSAKEIVAESGWEEFPFLVSRWEKLDNTPWGYGPGHEALPDMKTLNRLKELNLQQLVTWVTPPLEVLHEGVHGEISLAPLALNTVEQKGAVSPLNLTGRPDLVQLNEAALQKAIRDAFHVDDLLALPPPDQAGRMTATEVAQRISLMQRFMGPVFTALLSDFLNPLADRVFGLMLRAGVLPQVPPAVLEAAARAGGEIDVEYEGPLARAQRSADIQAVGDVLVVGQQMVQATGDTSLWDSLDMDETLRHVAKVAGLPRHLLRDPRQVGRMRQAQAAAQVQQQQAQTLRDDAEAMGKAAPVLQVLQGGGNAGGGG